MSLKELKSLAPWNWDPRAAKHPPKKAALQDFEKIESAWRHDDTSQTPGPAPTPRDRRRSIGLSAASNSTDGGWETPSANGLARKAASADRARSLLKRKAAELQTPESQQQQPAAQHQQPDRDQTRDRAADPDAPGAPNRAHPAAEQPSTAPEARRYPIAAAAVEDEATPAGGVRAAGGGRAADADADASGHAIGGAMDVLAAVGTAPAASNTPAPTPAPRDLAMRPPRWTPAVVRGPAAQLEPSPASSGAPTARLLPHGATPVTDHGYDRRGGGGADAAGAAKPVPCGGTPAAAGRRPDGKRPGQHTMQQHADPGDGLAVAPPPPPPVCRADTCSEPQPLAVCEDATPIGTGRIATRVGSDIGLPISSPAIRLTGRAGAGGGACGSAATTTDVPRQGGGGAAAAPAARARPGPAAAADEALAGSTPLAQAAVQRPCGPLPWHNDSGPGFAALATRLSVDRRTPYGCGAEDLPWLSPAAPQLAPAAARTLRLPLQRQLSSSSPTPPPCFEPSPRGQQQPIQQQRTAGCIAGGRDGDAAPAGTAAAAGGGGPDTAAVVAATARPSLLKLTPTTHKRFVLQGAIVEGISSSQPRSRNTSPAGPPGSVCAATRLATSARLCGGGGGHAQEDGQDFDPAAARGGPSQSPTAASASPVAAKPCPPPAAAATANLLGSLQETTAAAPHEAPQPSLALAAAHPGRAAGDGSGAALGAATESTFGGQGVAPRQPAGPSRSPLAARQGTTHVPPPRSSRSAEAAGLVARKLVLPSTADAAAAGGGWLGPAGAFPAILPHAVGQLATGFTASAAAAVAATSTAAAAGAAAPRVSASSTTGISGSVCAGQQQQWDGSRAAAEKGAAHGAAGPCKPNPAAGLAWPTAAAAAGRIQGGGDTPAASAPGGDAAGAARTSSLAAIQPCGLAGHRRRGGEPAADASSGGACGGGGGEEKVEEERPAKRRATEALGDHAGVTDSSAQPSAQPQAAPTSAATARQQDPGERSVPPLTSAAPIVPLPAADGAGDAAAPHGAPAAAGGDVVMAPAAPPPDTEAGGAAAKAVADLSPAATLTQQQLLVLDQLLGFFRATGCRHPSVMSAAELVTAISRFCQSAGIPVVPANIQTLASWLGTLLALEKPAKAYAQAQAQAHAQARAQQEVLTAAPADTAPQPPQLPREQHQRQQAQPATAPGPSTGAEPTAVVAAASPASASARAGGEQGGGEEAGGGERRVSGTLGATDEPPTHDPRLGALPLRTVQQQKLQQQQAARQPDVDPQSQDLGTMDQRCSRERPQAPAQQRHPPQPLLLLQQRQEGFPGPSRGSAAGAVHRRSSISSGQEGLTASTLPVLPLDAGAAAGPTPLEALAADWSAALSPVVTALYDRLASCQQALKSALLSAPLPSTQGVMSYGAAQRRPSTGSMPAPSGAAAAVAAAATAATSATVVAAAAAAAGQEAQTQGCAPHPPQHPSLHSQSVLAQQLQLLLAHQQQQRQQLPLTAPTRPGLQPAGAGAPAMALAASRPALMQSGPTATSGATSWQQPRGLQTQQQQQQQLAATAAAAAGTLPPAASSSGKGGPLSSAATNVSHLSNPQDPRPGGAAAAMHGWQSSPTQAGAAANLRRPSPVVRDCRPGQLQPCEPPPQPQPQPVAVSAPFPTRTQASHAGGGAVAEAPSRGASQVAWAAASGGSLGAAAAGPAAQRPMRQRQQQQQQKPQAHACGPGHDNLAAVPVAHAAAAASITASSLRAAAGGGNGAAAPPTRSTHTAAPPPPAAKGSLPGQATSQPQPPPATLQCPGREVPVARALQLPSPAAPTTMTSGAPSPYPRPHGLSAADDASMLQPSPVEPSVATGHPPAAMASYMHAVRPYTGYPSAAAGHGWHYSSPYGWCPSYGGAGRAEPAEPFGYPYPARGAAALYFHSGAGAVSGGGVHPSAAPHHHAHVGHHGGDATAGFDAQQQQGALAVAKAANRRARPPGLACGVPGYTPATGQPYGHAPVGSRGAPGWGCG